MSKPKEGTKYRVASGPHEGLRLKFDGDSCISVMTMTAPKDWTPGESATAGDDGIEHNKYRLVRVWGRGFAWVWEGKP